ICTYKGTLNSYEQLTVSINVKIEEPEGMMTTLTQEASVEGGEASKLSRALVIPINATPTLFGIANYELSAYNQDGTPATQAGAHPFQLTTTLALNQTSERYPVQLPKNLHFNLPQGLVGNPNAVTQCTMTDFFALLEQTNLCPASSVVGVAT